MDIQLWHLPFFLFFIGITIHRAHLQELKARRKLHSQEKDDGGEEPIDRFSLTILSDK